MKKVGMVKEVGKGYCIIVDKDLKEYTGLDEDMIDKVTVRDAVTFEGELKEKGDFKVLRAFFIRKRNK